MAVIDGKLWLEVITYVVIGVGIISNGIVVIVFVANSSRRMRQKWRNMYILHQSLIDGSSLVLLCLLRSITIDGDTFRQSTLGVAILCKFWVSEYFLWAMYTCSTYNLVIVSLERYLAVVYPIYHRTRLNKNKILASMVFPWVIGFAFQAYWPPMYRVDTDNGTCLPLYECSGGTPSTLQTFLTIYSFVGEYAIALVAMGFAYVRIVVTLRVIIQRKKKKNPAFPRNLLSFSENGKSANGETTVVCTVSQPLAARSKYTGANGRGADVAPPSDRSRTSRKPSKKNRDIFSEAKRNTVRTFLMVFALFIVCWTPTEVVYLRHNLCIEELDFEGTLYDWMLLVVTLNAVLNPFIYTGLYGEFQRQLRRVFCRRICSERPAGDVVSLSTGNGGDSSTGRDPATSHRRREPPRNCYSQRNVNDEL